MSRWLRALLISAVATAAAVLVLNLLRRPRERGEPPAGGVSDGQRSPDEVVDALSEAQKAQMLGELGRYV